MRDVVLGLGAVVALAGSGGGGPILAAQAAASDSPPRPAVARGDSLMTAGRTEAALDAWRRGLEGAPGDVTLLWKTSMGLSTLAKETPGREGDGTRLRESIELARQATRQGPQVSRAHTALAIALGSYGDYLAHVHRIQKAREVIDLGQRSYDAIERARVLDPGDYAPYVFLGVFHRRLATVHPLVKAIARTFLGGYPDVSLEESASLLRRAVELDPMSVSARTELALTYQAMERGEDARRTYREALELEPRSRLERIALDHAREYLAGSS
ncbi:MAG: hypothetical protein ACREMK_07915 [Gemmatimonadota bacterium]